MIAKIYRILNDLNPNVYVGFTTQTIQSRWNEHKLYCKRGDNTKLYNAMRKYGLERFNIQWLYSSKDVDHTLNAMEPLFILEFDSWHNGYNMTPGGEHYSPNTGMNWYNDGIRTRMFHDGGAPDGFVKGRIMPEGSKATQLKPGHKKSVGENNAMYGKTPWNRGLVGLTMDIPESDKLRRKEHMLKINSSRTGKVCFINDGIKNRIHDKKLPIPVGFVKGMLNQYSRVK